MKTAGIIAEYNPFHNGHAYHIEETRKKTEADYIIAVMSGSFVQRGTPAICDKHLRAETALQNGVDLVLELPVSYAVGSAEIFSRGAVEILDRLGIVNALSFGAETDDLEELSVIADFLLQEPEEYKSILQKNLAQGQNFAKARAAAIPKIHAEIFSSPNAILGIEYLKALKKCGSSIRPYTIRRKGAGYHSSQLDGLYSSASAIRSLLAYSSSSIHTEFAGDDSTELSFSDILNELGNQVPKKCLELLSDFHKIQYPVYQNDFSLILKYKLLNKHPKSLVRYMDVSPELAARICTSLNDFFNYKQFAGLLKTKELTQTRINRALLHIMLGIKKDSVSEYMNSGYNFYARLLGFRKDCSQILTEISKKSSLPLLTKLAESRELCELGQRMLRDDILASNLYTSVVTDKFKTAFLNEYKQRIIKI